MLRYLGSYIDSIQQASGILLFLSHSIVCFLNEGDLSEAHFLSAAVGNGLTEAVEVLVATRAHVCLTVLSERGVYGLVVCVTSIEEVLLLQLMDFWSIRTLWRESQSILLLQLAFTRSVLLVTGDVLL